MPNYSVAPGGKLKEYMMDEGLTVSDFSASSGMSPSEVGQILAGAFLTSNMIISLSRGTPYPKSYWSRINQQYVEETQSLTLVNTEGDLDDEEYFG